MKMRSIPAAMTWEMLSRGRWSLLAAALFGVIFPGLLLFALRIDGALDPHDASMIILHIVTMQMNLVLFAFAIFAAQGRTARLYAYPVRTSTLVACRLAPAMVLMALETALVTVVLNATFDVDWPVWGPALCLATALACVRAACWVTERSRWWVLAVTVVGVPIALWYKARYGSTFSGPTQMWTRVTDIEGLTMAIAAAAAFATAVAGVARNRRGEAPLTLGLLAWVYRKFDRLPADGGAFPGPLEAQAWFQWRRKGLIMPSGVVAAMGIGLVAWLFSDQNVNGLVEALFASGGMLALVGFLGGLAFGNVGPNDSHAEMGHFLATRPITSGDLARNILAAAARSGAAAAGVWAAALAIVAAILWTIGYG
jgi:hypothetical protein